jgi:YD repeat-containing protein
VTVSGAGSIDELRLYPATAQMTTYTYSPLIGMTTVCDIDNKITYYSYDGFGRLKWIKDQDGNIIKTMQYHFEGMGSLQF